MRAQGRGAGEVDRHLFVVLLFLGVGVGGGRGGGVMGRRRGELFTFTYYMLPTYKYENSTMKVTNPFLTFTHRVLPRLDADDGWGGGGRGEEAGVAGEVLHAQGRRHDDELEGPVGWAWCLLVGWLVWEGLVVFWCVARARARARARLRRSLHGRGGGEPFVFGQGVVAGLLLPCELVAVNGGGGGGGWLMVGGGWW